MHGYFCKVLGLQGSTDASAIWSLNWSVLFDVLDKCFHKARFPSPRHHVYTECNGKGFVDDTMLWEPPRMTLSGSSENRSQGPILGM